MSQNDHTFFSRAHKPGFSQLALSKQVNKLCHLTYQETGRSVHFDSIFLLKPPKLPFPFLFSLTLIIVMLSVLVLLTLSLIIQRVISYSAHLICKAPKSAHITPHHCTSLLKRAVCKSICMEVVLCYLSTILREGSLYCPLELNMIYFKIRRNQQQWNVVL